jgi:type VI protein secretion system component VasK
MSGAVFSSKNYKLLALSVALLIVGYILLGQGPVYSAWSWKIAPAILVAVYCVLLPYAIIAHARSEKKDLEEKHARTAGSSRQSREQKKELKGV